MSDQKRKSRKFSSSRKSQRKHEKIKVRKEKEKSSEGITSKYEFGEGLPANLWGPSANIFKHSVSLQNNVSPRQEKEYYRLTKYNLPCSSCTQSFSKFQKSHPYDVDSKLSKQLSYLFHESHNYVNLKNGKREVAYKENVTRFQVLSPKIWLLALIDYLIAIALHQIDRSTSVSSSKLPVQKFVEFLLTSDFLTSVRDTDVNAFVRAATSKSTSLLASEIYDLHELRKSQSSYLAKPFVSRLEQIRNHVFPMSATIPLENRVKIYLATRH